MTDEDYFKEAGKVAEKSLCLRDKCGAIIVLDGEIVGRGYSAPPHDSLGDRRCHLNPVNSLKPKSDRTCCVHAEWRAILEAVEAKKIVGSTLYFVRVDEKGEILNALGIPYCTVCSRLALETGVSLFCLTTKEGVKVFPTKEFNDLSYAFHDKSNL